MDSPARSGSVVFGTMKTLIIASITAIAVSASAQLLSTRNLTVCPLSDSTSTGFFAHSMFFGAIERGFGSAGDDRAWEAMFGGQIDLYRWHGGRQTLFARFAMATLANALNDIGFNPRGVQWEEDLGVSFPLGANYALEAGLTYRCKHDIDNSDPYNSDIPRDSGPAEKRVLIIGGPYAQLIPHELRLCETMRLRAAERIDVYFVREDHRFPTDYAWSMDPNICVSFCTSARLTWDVASAMNLYLRFNSTALSTVRSLTIYEEHIELGTHFAGSAGGMDLFAAYDNLSDDLSVPYRRMSEYWGIGLRLSGSNTF